MSKQSDTITTINLSSQTIPATMSAPQSSEVHGKRLIPHVIDHVAKTDPLRECFSIPLSSNPQDGWRSISYGQYATAIDRLAHHIVEMSGVPQPKTFPTVAYIGTNDAVYLIFVIAAIKAGYKVSVITVTAALF